MKAAAQAHKHSQLGMAKLCWQGTNLQSTKPNPNKAQQPQAMNAGSMPWSVPKIPNEWETLFGGDVCRYICQWKNICNWYPNLTYVQICEKLSKMDAPVLRPTKPAPKKPKDDKKRPAPSPGRSPKSNKHSKQLRQAKKQEAESTSSSSSSESNTSSNKEEYERPKKWCKKPRSAPKKQAKKTPKKKKLCHIWLRDDDASDSSSDEDGQDPEEFIDNRSDLCCDGKEKRSKKVKFTWEFTRPCSKSLPPHLHQIRKQGDLAITNPNDPIFIFDSSADQGMGHSNAFKIAKPLGKFYKVQTALFN